MDYRMRKYDNDENIQEESMSMSRTKRNSNVYASLDMNDLSRIKTNNNVSVISEDHSSVDLEKIRNYINKKNEEENGGFRKRMVLDIPDEEVKVERTERKDYNINSVLERAKERKETDYDDIRYRKINKAEYDILDRIKIKEEKKKNDDDLTLPIDELNTEERTIVDLLSNFKEGKNKSDKKEELFSDLMGDNEDTVVMPIINEDMSSEDIQEELNNMTRELNDLKKPLEELSMQLSEQKQELEKSMENEKRPLDEKNTPFENIEIQDKLEDTDEILKNMESKEDEDKRNDKEPPVIEKIEVEDKTNKLSKIDKSFFTNSLSFSKADFESFDDFKEKDNSIAIKIAIIIVILIILAVTIYVLNKILNIF